MYNKEDRLLFSLQDSKDVLIRNDIKKLWEDFFCLLFLAGLYQEGRASGGATVSHAYNPLSSQYFNLYGTGYNAVIGSLISKGLRERYISIMSHYDLTEDEHTLVSNLENILDEDKQNGTLSANDVMKVALLRDFSRDMITIVKYISVSFCQKDFVDYTNIDKIYINAFGDIYLSGYISVDISTPKLKYGEYINDCVVTPLWAMMSAVVTIKDQSYGVYEYPGVSIIDMLGNLGFMYSDSTNTDKFTTYIPIYRAINAFYLSGILGVDLSSRSGPIVGRFYQNILYGSFGEQKINRYPLFRYILNLMVNDKSSYSRISDLFPPESSYQRILRSAYGYNDSTDRTDILKYALEALDSDTEEKDASTDKEEDKDEDSEPEIDFDDTTTDPSTKDGGFDPSVPPPAVPASSPTMDKDTIDLISFDKTGEGIEEDLYRSAVVSLNDRLKSDDSVDISAEIREALDYWVNGFLYLASISTTKKQVEYLGLQKYLKNVSVKG